MADHENDDAPAGQACGGVAVKGGSREEAPGPADQLRIRWSKAPRAALEPSPMAMMICL